MRAVADYMQKAAEFDLLAARVDRPVPLRTRYPEIAECYRMLAKEHERLVAQGAILSEPLPSPSPP
jgi:hypothetical protein